MDAGIRQQAEVRGRRHLYRHHTGAPAAAKPDGFFNVGEHNNVRLENADWNDGLDMAYDKGETVAFSSFYAGNLMELSRLLRELKQLKAIDKIELSSEIVSLFDTLHAPVDYESVEAKRAALLHYYNTCRHDISGKKVSCDIDGLALDLEKKAQWLIGAYPQE